MESVQAAKVNQVKSMPDAAVVSGNKVVLLPEVNCASDYMHM